MGNKKEQYLHVYTCMHTGQAHTHKREKNVNGYMIKQFDFESSEMGGRWFFEVGMASCTYTLL